MNPAQERNLTIRERCDRGLPVSYEDVLDEARDMIIDDLILLPIGSGDLPDWLQDIMAEERGDIIDTICDAYEARFLGDTDDG